MIVLLAHSVFNLDVQASAILCFAVSSTESCTILTVTVPKYPSMSVRDCDWREYDASVESERTAKLAAKGVCVLMQKVKPL